MVWEDVQPELFGPFKSKKKRDRKAVEFRKEHGQESGYYKLTVEGLIYSLDVDTFSGNIFDEVDNEGGD